MHSKDLTHSINNANGKMTNKNPLIPDVPFHLGPLYKPLPELIKQNVSYPQSSQSSNNIDNINPNFDFEENSPFQDGFMSETFPRPDKSFFQESKNWETSQRENFIHKYFPKQTDIDKMIEVIQRKGLKGIHLPVEIKAGYLHSLYFKDIYLYSSQNKLPHSKVIIKRIVAFAEKYILLVSLLKINPEKETAVLAVPEACIDKIITFYPTNLFAGHQGVIGTYLTINDKFLIPNLTHYLRSYIKGYHLCQLA